MMTMAMMMGESNWMSVLFRHRQINQEIGLQPWERSAQRSTTGAQLSKFLFLISLDSISYQCNVNVGPTPDIGIKCMINLNSGFFFHPVSNQRWNWAKSNWIECALNSDCIFCENWNPEHWGKIFHHGLEFMAAHWMSLIQGWYSQRWWDCLGPASPIIKPNHCRFSENNPDHVMWFWWQTILMMMMKFKVDTRRVLHMTEMGGLKPTSLINEITQNLMTFLTIM